eukprot:542677-Pyramimonas_sp.AAC.1
MVDGSPRRLFGGVREAVFEPLGGFMEASCGFFGALLGFPGGFLGQPCGVLGPKAWNVRPDSPVWATS